MVVSYLFMVVSIYFLFRVYHIYSSKSVLYSTFLVLPLESVVSIQACILMAAWNPSNVRRPATYFYFVKHQVKYFHELINISAIILPQSENISATNGHVVVPICMPVYKAN